MKKDRSNRIIVNSLNIISLEAEESEIVEGAAGYIRIRRG